MASLEGEKISLQGRFIDKIKSIDTLLGPRDFKLNMRSKKRKPLYKITLNFLCIYFECAE